MSCRIDLFQVAGRDSFAGGFSARAIDVATAIFLFGMTAR
jgi:hypothetical protein